jgi:hypothetical protein
MVVIPSLEHRRFITVAAFGIFQAGTATVASLPTFVAWSGGILMAGLINCGLGELIGLLSTSNPILGTSGMRRCSSE